MWSNCCRLQCGEQDQTSHLVEAVVGGADVFGIADGQPFRVRVKLLREAPELG